MAVFQTKKYPSLVVKFADRERARFTNGTVEVSGTSARRLADFAERHPEFEIEQVEGEKEPTRKERVQAAARERGLDDSGTIAQIEARIAKYDEDEAGADEEQDDDADEDEAEDDSDEDSADE